MDFSEGLREHRTVLLTDSKSYHTNSYVTPIDVCIHSLLNFMTHGNCNLNCAVVDITILHTALKKNVNKCTSLCGVKLEEGN